MLGVEIMLKNNLLTLYFLKKWTLCNQTFKDIAFKNNWERVSYADLFLK